MKKRKIILVILSVLMISSLLYIGIFFSMEISKMQTEYNQTGIQELKDIIKSYYSIMYSYFLYSIIVYGILVSLDSFYLSRYRKITNGKSLLYWGVSSPKYIILFMFSRLVFINPHLYSSLALMVIFGYIALENLVINPYFVKSIKGVNQVI